MAKIHLKFVTFAFAFTFSIFVLADQNTARSDRFIGQVLTPQFIEELNKLSQSGDLEATVMLADINYDEYRNYAKAFNLYKMAAERNDVYATVKLGWIYLEGKGVKKSERNAAICFTQAAASKDFNGLRYLAYMYANGFGVENDFVVAHALYQIAIPLDSSRNYVEIANRDSIAKSLTSSQLAESKQLSKKLINSNNFFITIEQYLNEHGKLGFNGKPLLAFELDPS